VGQHLGARRPGQRRCTGCMVDMEVSQHDPAHLVGPVAEVMQLPQDYRRAPLKPHVDQRHVPVDQGKDTAAQRSQPVHAWGNQRPLDESRTSHSKG
jgi:hypothetical protein